MKLTQKQYLLSLGAEILNNPEKLEEAKTTYKRLYMKAYRKEYKTKKKRIKLTFTNEEFEYLARVAREYDKPLATYIKLCSLAYLNTEFLLPEEGKLQEFSVLIRRISNNVNQTARWANYNKFVQQDTIHHLHQQLSEIQKELDRLFQKPEKLLEVVEKSIDENPFFLQELYHLVMRKVNGEEE